MTPCGNCLTRQTQREVWLSIDYEGRTVVGMIYRCQDEAYTFVYWDNRILRFGTTTRDHIGRWDEQLTAQFRGQIGHGHLTCIKNPPQAGFAEGEAEGTVTLLLIDRYATDPFIATSDGAVPARRQEAIPLLGPSKLEIRSGPCVRSGLA